MNEDEWKAFFADYNRELLADEELRNRVPKDAISPDWLGYPPASEEEIAVAEARLGMRFPPSYRSFLRVSNGWRALDPFIWNLWSCAGIAWFQERNQEWIDAYNDPHGASDNGPKAKPLSDTEYLVYGDEQDTVKFREEYLQTALEISDRGDDAILLLNPKTVTPDGEWEAWSFANWYPGARRYRSFQEMMEQMRIEFRKLQEQRRQRAVQRAKTPVSARAKPWWKIW